jgi:predicted metalloprotease with PDZ domain
MEMYRKISRIVAIALFATSIVVLAMAWPRSATPDPFLSWSVSMKDPGLNLLTVRGKVFGRTGRKFAFVPAPQETGPGLEPIGLSAAGPDGRELDIGRSGEGWTVDCRGGGFTIIYDVVITIEDRYTPEVRRMLSQVGPEKSRLMGRDLFLQPLSPVSSGVIVDIDLYGGGIGRIGSPWDAVGTRMVLPSAAELPMTLVTAGDYRLHEISVSGVGLVLAIGGAWSFGDGELLDTVRSIVSEEVSMLGSSPRNRHLVIVDRNPVRGGRGFEYYGVHFGGTVLLLLDPSMDRSRLYDVPMSIVAHEFFHNWNGEALRPVDESFMWFTEGATVFVSYQVLLRAGIINGAQYANMEKGILERCRENPLRGSVSLTGAGNGDLTDRDMVDLLYDGGFAVSRAIDGRIAALTGGGSGLVDVIRRMYEESPGGTAIGLDELNAAITAETGHDLSSFIGQLLSDPLPDVSS